MAFQPAHATQNIDPALRQQNSVNTSPKPRDTYQNGPTQSYSPVQSTKQSPTTAFQGMPPTPSYYSKPVPHESPADDQSPKGDSNDPNDQKRTRACEACRGLKVKCEFDEVNSPDTCKRCAKAGRQCIVTVPSRKRQKKTDSRVAELEKKIDALTATLAAQGHSETDIHHPVVQSQLPPRPVYPEPWPHGQPAPPTRTSPTNTIHGVKRKLTGEFDYFGGELHKAQQAAAFKSSPTPGPSYPPPYNPEPRIKQEYEDLSNVDVVASGLVDVVTAQKCFERYVSDMCIHLPIVVFPPNTNWEDVRRQKPILFLAVLAVASGTIRNDLQPKLIMKATKILADRIVYRGEKSLEIVQTIQCMTTFYQPPEKYEELNFNQLIHIAAVMALDIGMGKRFKKGSLTLWRPFTDSKRSLPDPMSAETRRCWLGCYFMCSNSSMSLRRPLLVRWSNYADECVDILSNAEDAAPTDKWLCFLVRAQHIAEDIGLEFSMDDPASQVSLTDHKTQYHLKAFERQLEEWERSATPNMLKQPIMKHVKGIINLYMHEIAMHHNHNIDDFKPPFHSTPIDGPPDPDFVTPAHIESLTTCMRSVHDVFHAFLSMDVQQLRSLPTLFFVRNSYAAVALIKMYTAVSAKGSKFGSIISTDDLRVDYYLDRLIDCLARTAEGGMCKVAHKFSIIFNMLKQWHTRRTDPNSNSSNPVSRQRTPLNTQRTPSVSAQNPQQYSQGSQRDGTTTSWQAQPHHRSQQPAPHPQQQQQPQPPRSGLHMLSEAAMNPSAPIPNSGLPPSHQPQPSWLPPGAPPMNTMPPGMNPGEMQDPNLMYAGAMGANNGLGDFPDLDLNTMAYGFGDEFVAMGFGMGMGDGGWAF
ncbi:uncharacterized protein HMPREF1541_02301 [Cyphellophora europaea CBS 101466]|uniref:Zn(2)-C6 fungal-type domain-containing protein n=1 Tax=Cyphellophora europaea (strain CBS 101466) TaxID=1220924 RepID=W2S519_CYPE1|nr:uncharacterized protein HMPREF1541_02301 [Cyphellophora europaea CBS 101466]ETN43143.1 hypothetical protein HMPREF1541_02301 [Cyphellophora europaea CBS 101466]